MKKVAISFAVILCIIIGTQVTYASSTTSTKASKNEIVQSDTMTQLGEMKENEKQTLEDYVRAYNDNQTYGLTAYILNKVQIYSIPFCFVGIAISAIYQYVLGIRKLDTRDKGFAIMISIITIFIIAQILPLIFAIVVKGWRG